MVDKLKKGSDLPIATQLDDDDTVFGLQESVTKRFSASMLRGEFGNNVKGLQALQSGASKSFYFVDGQGRMATYDLGSLGIKLSALSDDAAGQAAGRAAIKALGATEASVSSAKLTTPRSIASTGDASWSVSFDGSANVSAALTLAASGITPGSYVKLTVDSKGRATAGQAGPLGVADGGTGGANASSARTALGAASSGANGDITSLNAIVGSAFTNFTLMNGWTTLSGFRAAYRKYLGMLQIEMAVSAGTTADGTTIATLPSGFRPPFSVALPVATNAASGTISGRVTIGTDGAIKVYNCTSQIVFVATLGLE